MPGASCARRAMSMRMAHKQTAFTQCRGRFDDPALESGALPFEGGAGCLAGADALPAGLEDVGVSPNSALMRRLKDFAFAFDFMARDAGSLALCLPDLAAELEEGPAAGAGTCGELIGVAVEDSESWCKREPRARGNSKPTLRCAMAITSDALFAKVGALLSAVIKIKPATTMRYSSAKLIVCRVKWMT